jgi:erythromycin esterase-like protein
MFPSHVRAGLVLPVLALVMACGSGTGGATGSATLAPQPTTAATPTPVTPTTSGTPALIAASARPISGAGGDYADIIAAAGDTRRVLLGESTHGTREYYRERGRITERLAAEHGFNAVTIEGDATPTFRLNLYVRGLGEDRSAAQALEGFSGRFPRWMWRNAEFREFAERLRTLNMSRPLAQRVGIYGMDVYDLYDAADWVVRYVQPRDAAAASRIRALYACFAPYDRDTGAYGQAMVRRTDTCRDEAEAAAAEVARLPQPTDPEQAEYHFGAKRAAASVVSAEAYFRISYGGGENSWNVRDRGMEATVEAVAAHAAAQSGQTGKTVSWSHNTHTGNAAATSSALSGELNLGQLMRARHGNAALLVGFFSHTGTVFAAPQWGAEGRVYDMRTSAEGGHENLFRQAGLPAFSLLLRDNAAVTTALRPSMPQRAIGVIYLPQTEAQSHYLQARLSEQFDAVVFFERSDAVTPL